MDSTPLPTTCGRPSDAPPTDAIPDLLLLKWIGKGSFGQVWLAENRMTGRLVAAKLVLLKPSGKVELATREIQALSRLERNRAIQHPNLLSIHHVGKTQEYLYYTMDPADNAGGGPACRGESYVPATLGARLRAGRLSADECLNYAQQLLAALACLHREGLVHRDVKPDNCIFLDGDLKLSDFGLVTEADGSISLAGTPHYMPKDYVMDARADVYAAGLVIYEMYSGNPVSRFPSLAPRGSDVTKDSRLAALNRIVLRATDPARELRYEDCQQMLADLRRSVEHHTTENGQGVGTTKPAGRLARLQKHRVLLVALACLFVGLVLSVFWLLAHQPGMNVDVNFITEPYGARVVLDGVLLECENGPCVTPCTVRSLTGEKHRVVFRHPVDGERDVGIVDFARIREVFARWQSTSAEPTSPRTQTP